MLGAEGGHAGHGINALDCVLHALARAHNDARVLAGAQQVARRDGGLGLALLGQKGRVHEHAVKGALQSGWHRDGLVEVVVHKAVGRRGEVLEPRVKLEQVEVVAEQSLVARVGAKQIERHGVDRRGRDDGHAQGELLVVAGRNVLEELARQDRLGVVRVPKLRKVPVLLEVGDWLFGGRGGVEFRLRGAVEFVECLLAGLLLGSELLQGGQGGGRKTAETKMKMPVWLAQNLKNYVVYICMHGPGQEEYLAILRVPMTRLPIAPQDPGPNPKNQPRLEVSAMT